MDSLIVGVDRLTTKVGSQSSEISRTSSTKKTSASSGGGGSGVQLRRPKRGLMGYASQGGGGSSSLGVSSGGSGASVASNNRSRIYSHRDNDDLFADLTYAPAASSSRHTTLCQMSKGTTTCERSSVSFESENSCCLEEDGKDHKRPRTASDTGTKWKSSITAPIRLLPSSNQVTDAISRPRARSLTQQLATKPLSQPIGVKDLEGTPSGEVYNGGVQVGSRSCSTTSTSKSIRRALEHVLGRPRSTEEAGDGLMTNAISPSHHYNNNNNGINQLHQLQNDKRLQDSEIYVEMDFPPPPQSSNHSHNNSTELTQEMRNALRGSLLITPSDSLSSNSSCLSFYGGSGGGCGGSCGGGGKQSLPLSRNITTASFTEHYGMVFGQALASTISTTSTTTKTPFFLKSSNTSGGNAVSAAAAAAAAHTTGCDISSPTSAH